MPQREKTPAGFPLGRGIFATAWPAAASNDSNSLRRRKFAVRAGHLAMAMMIIFSAGTAIAADRSNFNAASLTFLGITGACYVLWNLVGTQGIVTLVLWEKSELPPAEIRMPRCGALIYFTVQVALAGLVCITADHSHLPNLVWLVWLTPFSCWNGPEFFLLRCPWLFFSPRVRIAEARVRFPSPAPLIINCLRECASKVQRI